MTSKKKKPVWEVLITDTFAEETIFEDSFETKKKAREALEEQLEDTTESKENWEWGIREVHPMYSEKELEQEAEQAKHDTAQAILALPKWDCPFKDKYEECILVKDIKDYLAAPASKTTDKGGICYRFWNRGSSNVFALRVSRREFL